MAHILLLVSETLSTIEAKQLLQLCKTGRLFDVQNWISSGNSLSVPAELKTTPLRVALDTGFFSLVELLVSNEQSQVLKNQALDHALSHRRLDLIELLVSHGAEISSVPFVEALLLWDPTNSLLSRSRRRLYYWLSFCRGLRRKNSNHAWSVAGV